MAFDEWLSVDSVSRSDSPEAYRKLRGISLRPEALVVAEPETITVVPWKSILSVVEADDRLYVLCPRRPPEAPWVTFVQDDADAVGESLESLKHHIETRARQVGYRDASPTRPRLSPAELHARVLANDPVPGTVEVPVGAGPAGRRSRSRKITHVATGASMGAMGGLYGGGILMALLSSHPAIALLSGLITGGVAGAATMYHVTRDEKGTGRVLALAPDGVVIGLPEGVNVFPWHGLGAFRAEPRVAPGGSHQSFPHLIVVDAHGEEVGAIDETWFGRPLAIIVEVAEAYRSRFTER